MTLSTKLLWGENPLKAGQAACALILNIRCFLKERSVYSSVAEYALVILFMICLINGPVFMPSERMIPKM